MSLQDNLTDKEKCIVVQMMLRQSPRLAKVPTKVKEAIQLFYKNKVYPELTPQDISQINLDMDKFLHDAEAIMQKGLISAVGGDAVNSILKKFNIGKKDSDVDIDPTIIKEMEATMRKEVDENDGT